MSGRPRQGVVKTAEWLVPRATMPSEGKAPRVRSADRGGSRSSCAQCSDDVEGLVLHSDHQLDIAATTQHSKPRV